MLLRSAFSLTFQLGGSLGNIGSLIAKRLEAFGGIRCASCCVPLNKETRHIVNRSILDAVGKDGIIINIGRGANVDETAMIRAKEGRIAGAGLDVFENEPEVPAELLFVDNVVLMHHVAILTSTFRIDQTLDVPTTDGWLSNVPNDGTSNEQEQYT